MIAFGIFLLLVFAAASTGAIFKPGEWYEQLNKPRWTPPGWAFPVVWSALYIMIAIAGWLVWRTDQTSLAVYFWAAQWVFNSAWSWLFFGLKRMHWGLADICLLWLSALGFIVSAWAISPMASWLFMPYLLWISIAGLLNFTVWRMNPQWQAGRQV
jgi:benzodiazapine receptor